MPNKSKRELEREVERLSPEPDDPDGGIRLILTSIDPPKNEAWPRIEDSPHKELTVKPWAEKRPNCLKIATPNIIPDPWCHTDFLMVNTCENAEKYGGDSDTGTGNTVAACELWEALDDDDLRREKAIRQENGDPIPDILDPYTPE